MLATKFIRDGYTAVRHPVPRDSSEGTGNDPLARLASRYSFLPDDPEQLARLRGAVQLTAPGSSSRWGARPDGRRRPWW
ncbi:hypothetical protein LUR56_15275 [Streptomyces sp. MT29]|nr:hypothetical protein [Streptomyces sp. MT29]